MNRAYLIAGNGMAGITEGEEAVFVPSYFWCPEQAESQRYLSTIDGGFHSSFTSIIRSSVAGWLTGY